MATYTFYRWMNLKMRYKDDRYFYAFKQQNFDKKSSQEKAGIHSTSSKTIRFIFLFSAYFSTYVSFKVWPRWRLSSMNGAFIIKIKIYFGHYNRIHMSLFLYLDLRTKTVPGYEEEWKSWKNKTANLMKKI